MERRVMERRYRLMAGVVFGVGMLCSGTAAASDYPPDAPAPTTVVVNPTIAPSTPGAPGAPSTPVVGRASSLPATGSDSGTTLMIAGGAVIAGSGILVAAKVRRRPSKA